MTGVLLPTLPLEAGAVGGAAVMSKVDNVTTTTNNTVVASASAAVSLGRWSSLAIIAFAFLCWLAYVTIETYSPNRAGAIAQLYDLLLV
jgi:hypothetical protein